MILDLLVMKDRFSRYLDAVDRATGPANLMARPTPMGEDANATATHVTSNRAQSRPARRQSAPGRRLGQRALQGLALPPYTDQRRDELLSLYTQLEKRIQDKHREQRVDIGRCKFSLY